MAAPKRLEVSKTQYLIGEDGKVTPYRRRSRGVIMDSRTNMVVRLCDDYTAFREVEDDLPPHLRYTSAWVLEPAKVPEA